MSRPRNFTLEQAVEHWRCPPDRAEEFLRDFVRSGFVVPSGNGWRVTRRGIKVSRAVQSLEPERQP